MKSTLAVVIVVLVTFGGALVYFQQQRSQTDRSVDTFTECVGAGFSVTDSYPPQCRTEDGRVFTEDIGNEGEYQDIISIDSPRPNALVTSPLFMSGQARGTWYFEGTFPIELFDGDGNSIGSTPATATEPWMTEDFVPFVAEVTFMNPTTPVGRLVIRNANPSGLPGNQEELVIPIRFAE